MGWCAFEEHPEIRGVAVGALKGIRYGMTRSAHLRFFLVSLVVVLALGACQHGPGSESPRVVPAWSPPNWVHGTWTWSGEGGSITLKASMYNVEFDIRASGVTYSVDVAQIAEDGFSAINYNAGVDPTTGKRFYFVWMYAADGSATGYHFFRESADEVAASVLVWTGRVWRAETGPYYLTKQER